MGTKLLTVDGLETRLRTPEGVVRPVDGVSFELEAGKTYALLGESGCGKSMTALSVMRLLPPTGRITGGRVLLQGEDLLALPEQAMRRVRGGRIAMIFQEPQSSLNPVLTVGEQVGEILTHHGGVRGRARRERVVELLDAVGIPDPGRRCEEYPHQLSGGMKQRVMIAGALAGEPELLIADEPTTALDVTIQAQVLALLRDLQRRSGMAVLLITHDLGVVAEMADRVAVMYAGQVVEESPSRAFFGEPAHPYSTKLFASLPGVSKRETGLAVIPGTVPPLTSRFEGCRFATRCDRALPHCGDQVPDWHDADTGHRVRCHLFTTHEGEGSPAPAADAQPVAAAGVPAAEGEAETVLHVRQLKVHFPIQRGLLRRVVGHVRAVDGVSLDVGRGRTVALVGESGCGKTTVGKGILRLVPPTSGEVVFDGADLSGLGLRAMRPWRRHMQIVFQDPYSSMNPRMMVRDIIEEGMIAQGIGAGRTDRVKRVEALLEQVGLPGEAVRRYPHEFSGGQRQRICIARALAVEPRLIVCDEPTSALDVSVQAQILNLLGDLQRRLDLSYLFITHDLSVVEYMAHRVAVMYLGRIVETGTTAEVLDAPRHPYTRALLSAIPVIDPETRREVIRLEGELPSPVSPPDGCHFHPRCPEASPACRTSYPKVHEASATHKASCHLYGD